MSAISHAQRVRQYYQDTQILYTLFWTEPRALSMNVGVWTRDTRTRVEALENQNAVIAELLKPLPDERILEAGCGTGGSSIWMSQRFATRGWGITLSDQQARLATRYARERGVVERLRFSVMDFTRTAFLDASFSAVFASESVCHAERKDLFLAEAFRLLVPGGRLVVIDAFLSGAALEPRQQKLLDEWRRGWVVPNLATVPQFASWMSDAGFESIDFRDMTEAILPSARRLFVWGAVGTPVFHALRAVRLASPAQVGHAIACRRVMPLVSDGVCRFGAFSAKRPGAAMQASS